MASIRAIIPAAGIGKRMRPLTLTRPKVLLPLAGRPIIGHLIADLVRIGVTEITVVVGYYHEKVEEYCNKAFPEVNFRFILQEERLGLGHAVGEAIAPDDEAVLIVLGDTLFRGNIGDLTGDSASLGLVEVDDPTRFGIAVVEDDQIVNLEEKPDNPRSNLALAGVYFVPDAQKLAKAIQHIVENDIKTRGEYQITDALQKMIEDGEPFRPVTLDGWYDCGLPSTLLETNQILLDEKPELNKVPEKFRSSNIILEPVSLDESAKIENCVIGPYVHVGQEVSLKRSVVRNSIIDAKSVIEGQQLDGAVLGQEVEGRSEGESVLLGDNSTL